MDALLKDLCSLHELTGISANLFQAEAKPFFQTYVEQNGEFASALGDTFDEALTKALALLAERRTPRAA